MRNLTAPVRSGLDWIADRLEAPFDLRWIQTGRTLLAMGMLLTITLTPSETLYAVERCDSVAGWGLNCVTGSPQATVLIGALVLVWVASGLTPLISSVLHWWVSWSLFANSSLFEGGDQLAAIVTLLLIPVFATRPWVWAYRATPPTNPTARVVANTALALISFQLFVLYFQAAIAKLGVSEWVEGTAMWYLLNEPSFGLGAHGASRFANLVAHAPVTAALTWTPLLIELAIAACQLGSHRARRIAIALGVVLHVAIALVMGIVSFSLVMIGALTISAARGTGPRTMQAPPLERTAAPAADAVQL